MGLLDFRVPAPGRDHEIDRPVLQMQAVDGQQGA